jgi:endonuclease YncB( thermonuclease family)
MQRLLTRILSLTTFLLIFPVLSFGVQHRVIRILDGDTIVLDNGEHVRLIGVDTTEKSHPLKPVEYFSEEATIFIKDLLEGQQVTLEYDTEKRGKYGRLLAYIYLLDGTLVNAEIIKQGYGFAYIKYFFKYKDRFISLEKEAEENRRGYWKYGGKGELTWILQKGQTPFLVYQMSQNLWGVKYEGFIKTRLNNEQLLSVLTNLRRWVHEFHEDDLKEQLLTSGWQKGDNK